MRFPRAPLCRGSQSSTQTGAWRGNPSLTSSAPRPLGSSPLSSHWVSRKANFFTVNIRKMTPGDRSIPSFPVPLPKPYQFERQEQRTAGTPVGVQRQRRAHSHQTTPEARTRCRPSTGRKPLACPGSHRAVAVASGWSLSEPSGPLHTTARTSLGSSHLSLSLACLNTSVQGSPGSRLKPKLPDVTDRPSSSSHACCPPLHQLSAHPQGVPSDSGVNTLVSEWVWLRMMRCRGTIKIMGGWSQPQNCCLHFSLSLLRGRQGP